MSIPVLFGNKASSVIKSLTPKVGIKKASAMVNPSISKKISARTKIK